MCSFEPWIAWSADKGDNWELKFLPSPMEDNIVFSLAFHPDDSDVIYAGLYDQVLKTSDAGQNWNYTTLKNVSTQFTALAVDNFNPDHVWAGGKKRGSFDYFKLWETFDGGNDWQKVVPNQGFDLAGISSLVADPIEPGVVYIGTLGQGVWRYKNTQPSLSHYFPLQIGNRWTFAETITESVIDTMKVSDTLYYKLDSFKHQADIFFRWTSDNHLLMRHGQTQQFWLDFSAHIGDNWKVTDPGGGSEYTVHLQSKTDTVSVPAGTFTNCYRFWFQFNGADNDWVEWYAPGVGPVKRILYGYAVIDYPLTSAFVNGFYLPTVIEETPESNKPGQFYLYPNYPNPFNAMTVIPFDLPHSSFVTLEIYDLIGKKVRTLLADQKPAGRFEVQWDGMDELNQAVASGIYFCRLKTAEILNQPLIQVRKLLLLR